jgi:hypothetical protein
MIWSCTACNNEVKSALDELLRDILAASMHTQGHPAAREAFEKLLRNERLATSELRHYAEDAPLVYIPGTAGIQVPAYAVDIPRERINTVISWILRGLYFYYLQRPIPQSSVFRMGLHYDVTAFHRRIECTSVFPRLKHETIGNGDVFECWYFASPDDVGSYWLLQFYRSVIFAAIIASDASLITRPRIVRP